jgi:hypothetical protein
VSSRISFRSLLSPAPLSANPLSGANQEIRDYSGKKPRQYLVSQEAAVSQDTFHSKYTRLLEKRDAAT